MKKSLDGRRLIRQDGTVFSWTPVLAEQDALRELLPDGTIVQKPVTEEGKPTVIKGPVLPVETGPPVAKGPETTIDVQDATVAVSSKATPKGKGKKAG